MDKPISIIVEDTKKSLADVLNTSGLPLSVIKMIVNTLNNEVNELAVNEYKRDLELYNKKQEEETKIEESPALDE